MKIDNEIQIKEFRDNEFVKITQDFFQQTGQYIEEMSIHDPDLFKTQLIQIFNELGNAPVLKRMKVGQIGFSLLRTSIWEEKQLARIDVYDKNQITGKLLFSTTMDVSWLFSAWKSYRENIKKAVEKKGITRYVKEPVIDWLMESKVTELSVWLYFIFKYEFCDADLLEGYDMFEKQEYFYISVGEYQDWQNIVYAVVDNLDLKQELERQPIFQKIEKTAYKGITFRNLNLSASRFSNCEFVQCKFIDCNLNDVRFRECRIDDVEIQGGSMYGAFFERCTIADLDTSLTQKEWKATGKEKEMYRMAAIYDCKIAGEEQI